MTCANEFAAHGVVLKAKHMLNAGADGGAIELVFYRR